MIFLGTHSAAHMLQAADTFSSCVRAYKNVEYMSAGLSYFYFILSRSGCESLLQREEYIAYITKCGQQTKKFKISDEAVKSGECLF